MSDLHKRDGPEDSLRPASSAGIRESMASADIGARAETPNTHSRPLSSNHDPRPASAYMLPLPNSTAPTPQLAVQQLPPDVSPEPNSTTTPQIAPAGMSLLPPSSRPNSTVNPHAIPPLPLDPNLHPPLAPFSRDSTATSNLSFSSTQPPAAALPYDPRTSARDSAVIEDKEKGTADLLIPDAAANRRPWSRRRKLFLVAGVLAIVAIIAVAIVTPLTLRRKHGGGHTPSQ